MKKIKITESDLYNIIRQVLLEQEEEKVIEFSANVFEHLIKSNSEKFSKYLNKFYNKIVVNGEIDLIGAPITILPDNLHVVESDLLLGGTLIKSLPDNLYVSGDLDLYKIEINSLPDNLMVRGHINLYGTPLSRNDKLVKDYIAKGYRISIY